jgi:hypothetical protein
MKFAQFALVALVVAMTADYSYAQSSDAPTVVTTAPVTGTGPTVAVTGSTTTTVATNRFNGAENIRPSAVGLAALIFVAIIRRLY